LRRFRGYQLGERFANHDGMAVSVLVGRLAAMMCHPVLAWKHLNSSGRVALAAGYAGLTYLTALILLFSLRG